MWRDKCRKHKSFFHTAPMCLCPALSVPTTYVPRLTVLRKSWAVPGTSHSRAPSPTLYFRRGAKRDAAHYRLHKISSFAKIANHHHPLLGPNRRPFHPRLRLSYYVVDTPRWEELPISPGHTTMRPRPPTNVVKQENTHDVLLLGLASSEAMMDNRS